MADVRVEEAFAHAFQPAPTQPGVVYQLPAISAFAFTVATVPLGIATGAQDAFVALAAAHKHVAMSPAAYVTSGMCDLGLDISMMRF